MELIRPYHSAIHGPAGPRPCPVRRRTPHTVTLDKTLLGARGRCPERRQKRSPQSEMLDAALLSVARGQTGQTRPGTSSSLLAACSKPPARQYGTSRVPGGPARRPLAPFHCVMERNGPGVAAGTAPPRRQRGSPRDCQRASFWGRIGGRFSASSCGSAVPEREGKPTMMARWPAPLDAQRPEASHGVALK